ncbi:mannosyl-3-phosphoglycerate synthase [Chloroflexota bacterium]
MRIESPRYTERFGSVRINDVQRVLELDSGRAKTLPLNENIAVNKVEEDDIKDFEEKMAIIIPIKDEKLKLFEGVISGVPHECTIIAISNSRRKRVDRYKMEKDTLGQYCRFTRRDAVILHQKDPVLGKALADSGYTDILGEDGLVKNGKAEGMLAATLIASVLNKQYVGFIDADNYFPGSVWEYVKCYAAGFIMSKSPYSMTRILWRYKPKITSGIYFKKWGRVSEITNKHMNNLISCKTGFDTEVIKTGNAGEHAMSLKLAEILPFAPGYAVEPQEFISMFEGYGGILPGGSPSVTKHGVDIFQIETRNPHLHEDKGEKHLQTDMLLPGLGTIYHSRLCENETRQLILNELLQLNVLKAGEEPPKPSIINPFKSISMEKFTNAIGEYIKTCSALENQ